MRIVCVIWCEPSAHQNNGCASIGNLYVIARIICVASTRTCSQTALKRQELVSMGKKLWLPKGAAPDPRWVDASADRLSNVRRSVDASAEATSAASSSEARSSVEPSATLSRPAEGSYAGRRSQGVQPRGPPTNPAEELAALRLGRTSPATFNIQRQAVMICGRPVVVLT